MILVYSMSMEVAKELAFGAAAGLAAGYASRKLSSGFVAGASTAGFLLLRAAIFEGAHLATWSPLAQDDPSFANHMLRKARKETMKPEKRAEIFFKDNVIVIGGFAGGIILGANY